MAQTYSLYDVLGWSKTSPITPPFISYHDTPQTSSDILIAAFISHTLLTGGTLAYIGIQYDYVHISSLCKRLGADLQLYTKSGHLFYIDCSTASTFLPLSSSSSSSSQSSSLPPLPTLPGIIARIAVAKNIYDTRVSSSSSSSSSSSPIHHRFCICIDNLNTLSLLNNSNITTIRSFIYTLLHTFRCTNGSICIGVTRLEGESALSNNFPSTSASIVLPPNTFIPRVDPDALFDLPVYNGGLSTMIAHSAVHWATTLGHQYEIDALSNPSECDTSITAPYNLCIDVSALTSGYSKDIYAQLSIFKTPVYYDTSILSKEEATAMLSNTQAVHGLTKALTGSLSVVFLSVDNYGGLICHARS